MAAATSKPEFPKLSVSHSVLANGLAVYVLRNEQSSRCYADLWFGVGSECETEPEYGMAHFLEHMMFKGSARLGPGEIDKRTAKAGGYNNAATSAKYTHFYFVMPMESLETALKLLSEMCTKPAIDGRELERERLVVIEEIKQYEDDPVQSPYLRHLLAFYAGTPFSHNVLGSPTSLLEMTPEMMRNYHLLHYRSGNSALVLSGALPDEDRLMALVNKHFGTWKRKEVEAGQPRAAKLVPGECKLIYPASQEAVYGYVSLPAPGGDLSKEAAHFSLLAYILGGSYSSRLNQALVERESLCQEFDFGSEELFPLNSAMFRFVTDKSEKVERILELYRENLHKIALTPPSWDELSCTKAAIASLRAFGSEDTVGAGSWLGEMVFPRRQVGELERYLEYLDRAVPEEISLLAEKLLLGIKRVNVTVSYPHSQHPPAIPDSLREYFSLSRKFAGSAEKTERPGPGLIGKLECGAEVYGCRRDDTATTAVRTYIPYNILDEPIQGIAQIANSLLLKGTKKRSAMDISKAFERVGGGIRTSFTPTHIGLTAGLLASDLGVLLELIPELLSESTFGAVELDKARWEAETKLATMKDDNQSVCWEKYCLKYFKGSPYGVQPLGTEESLLSIRAGGVRKYARDVIHPADVRIFIAGKYDDKDVLSRLNEHFETKKFFGVKHSKPAEKPLAGNRAALFHRMDKEQSALIFGFPAVGQGHDDLFLWQIWNTILGVGASSRLFSRLRDRDSMAYSVASSYLAGRKYGFIAVYILTSNEKLDNAWRGIWRELEALQSKPPSKSEFLSARRFLATQCANALETNDGRCREMADAVLLGLPSDTRFQRARKIRAIEYERFLKFAGQVTVENWGAAVVGRNRLTV